MEILDVFNRDLDITKCAENFQNEIKTLSDDQFTFHDFELSIYRSATIGKIEHEHVRPLVWKILLDKSRYTKLKEEKKMNLDQLYTDFLNEKKAYTLKLKLINSKKKFNKDPLTSSNDPAWQKFYHIQEVKKILRLDLVRTYPDKKIFQSKFIQDIITNVLTIWASENEEMSYRQGMNEIIAVIIYSIYPYYFINEEPSKIEDTSPKGVYSKFFNKNTLETHAYLIFSLLMKNNLKKFYETSSSVPTDQMYKKYDLFVFKNDKDDEVDNELKKHCDFIIKKKLSEVDSDLYNHFLNIEVNCSIFLQKWIKCLFNREFTPENVIIIWDVLLNDFDFIDYIIIEMLESMRNILMKQNQDDVFQTIFTFKDENKKNAIEVIGEALEIKRKFELGINKNSVEEVRSSNSGLQGTFTPYSTTNRYGSTVGTLGANVEAPAFYVKNAISSLGNFIKEVVAVDINDVNKGNKNEAHQGEQMIKFSAREVSIQVSCLELILEKCKDSLSPDEVIKFKNAIHYFKTCGQV